MTSTKLGFQEQKSYRLWCNHGFTTSFLLLFNWEEKIFITATINIHTTDFSTCCSCSQAKFSQLYPVQPLVKKQCTYKIVQIPYSGQFDFSRYLTDNQDRQILITQCRCAHGYRGSGLLQWQSFDTENNNYCNRKALCFWMRKVM